MSEQGDELCLNWNLKRVHHHVGHLRHSLSNGRSLTESGERGPHFLGQGVVLRLGRGRGVVGGGKHVGAASWLVHDALQVNVATPGVLDDFLRCVNPAVIASQLDIHPFSCTSFAPRRHILALPK